MLLDIKELSVSYKIPRGQVRAVSDLSMRIPAGVSVGIVGESGCGKTTLAKALTRLLPDNGRIEGGQVLFDGRDLTSLSEKQMREIRWRDISIVPQSAMNSLNPVYRVGDQLIETMVVREGAGRRAARARAAELFEMVGIDPVRLQDYPHQFSGGMKQRATIAMAMALSPRLIIADEPTTALDVLVEGRILELLQRLKEEHSLTIIYITHDLSVVARTCDYMGVMYAAKLVEFGPTRQVIQAPRHPYTMGLIAAVPKGNVQHWEPVSIPGSPPDLLQPPPACRFAERCPFATETCTTVYPDLLPYEEAHLAACHYAAEAHTMRSEAELPQLWQRSRAGQVEMP
jgi:oligopeptide/dipeptide ABC transporter ATP-binding protein